MGRSRQILSKQPQNHAVSEGVGGKTPALSLFYCFLIVGVQQSTPYGCIAWLCVLTYYNRKKCQKKEPNPAEAGKGPAIDPVRS